MTIPLHAEVTDRNESYDNRLPLTLRYVLLCPLLVMEEAEVDKNGCKVISVPLGTGSLQLVKKALLRLHNFQFKRNQLSCPSPTEGSKYRDIVQRYRDGQVQQNLQSSHIRSADCAIRDSYNLTKFNDMVSYL